MAVVSLAPGFTPLLENESFNSQMTKGTFTRAPTIRGLLSAHARPHSSGFDAASFGNARFGTLFRKSMRSTGGVRVNDRSEEVARRRGIRADASDTPTSFNKREAAADNMGESFRNTLVNTGRRLQDYLENHKISKLMANGEDEPEDGQALLLVRTLQSAGSTVSAFAARPAVKTSLLVFLVGYAICVVWGARLLLSDKKKDEAQEEFGSQLRLQKLKTLKADLKAGNLDSSTEKDVTARGGLARPTVGDEEFMERVRKIQGMARAVCRAEQGHEDYKVSPSPENGSARFIKGNTHLSKGSVENLRLASDGEEVPRPEVGPDFDIGKLNKLADGDDRSDHGDFKVPTESISTASSSSEAAEEIFPTIDESLSTCVESTGATDLDLSRCNQINSSRNGDTLLSTSISNDLPRPDETKPLGEDFSPTPNGSATSAENLPSPPSIHDVDFPTNGHATLPFSSAASSVLSDRSQPQKFKSMRVITSPEEARARIAAKKAKEVISNDTDPKAGFSSKGVKSKIGTIKESRLQIKSDDLDNGTTARLADVGSRSESLKETAVNGPGASVSESIPSDRSGKTHVTGSQESDVGRDQHREVKETSDRQERPSKEEQEEMEWMKDEILRAVVFKVRDNEEAGRESFYGLDSEEEQLFFKGLERKFEREGDLVKTWIQSRVENLDYGTGGIGVDDKPETYMPKWKSSDSVGGRSMDKFNEDRMRIMQQQMGNSSNPDTQTPSTSNTSSTSSSSSPTKSESLPRQDNLKIDALTERRQSKEHASSSGNKTDVTSSGRKAKPETKTWQSTKKWGQELQQKYDSETDPAQRGLMRDVGQDLDRWITEDEINEAARLLSNGVEGEKDYARNHFEKAKAKIQQQHEIFGQQAMLNKYGEYQIAKKESELWWLDLPYVLCIGLTTSANGEVSEGLYSLDMTPNFEGIVEGKQETKYHTVGFQDRKDALNFCAMLLSQNYTAEVLPFPPKDLYKEAKAEGFKVSVLKKGQLGLSPGQPLEDVEQRIVEIGSAVYWEELERGRSIDIDAVLDEGIGYGRS